MPLDWIVDIAPTINSNNSTDKKNKFINMAKNEVNSTIFSDSDTYNLAVAYYACHLLELSSRGGDSKGVLTQEKEGDLSRSYGGSNNPNISMNTTQYLDSYNRLLKVRVPNFYISHGNKISR